MIMKIILVIMISTKTTITETMTMTMKLILIKISINSIRIKPKILTIQIVTRSQIHSIINSRDQIFMHKENYIFIFIRRTLRQWIQKSSRTKINSTNA